MLRTSYKERPRLILSCTSFEEQNHQDNRHWHHSATNYRSCRYAYDLLRPDHNCADTPTVPPTRRSCRYACDPRLCWHHTATHQIMIVPLCLLSTDQSIDQALRLTRYHHLTLAPYCYPKQTAISPAAVDPLLLLPAAVPI